MGTKNNINKPPPRNLQRERRIKKQTHKKNSRLGNLQLVTHAKVLSKKKKKKQLQRIALLQNDLFEREKLLPEKDMTEAAKIEAESNAVDSMEITAMGGGTTLGGPPNQAN